MEVEMKNEKNSPFYINKRIIQGLTEKFIDWLR